MDIKERHRYAKEHADIAVHKFKSKYRSTSDDIHAFVEGFDDPLFYRKFINRFLSSDTQLIFYPCKGKKNVYGAYGKIDWSIFPKNKILFFVDKDFGQILNSTSDPHDVNIYVTDYYSIENSVVTPSNINSLVRDIWGESTFSDEEVDSIVNAFENAKKSFLFYMIPIMDCLLYIRIKEIDAQFNDIDIEEIFAVSHDSVTKKSNPRGKRTIPEYVACACGLEEDFQIVTDDKSCFTLDNMHEHVRGKYLLKFCCLYFDNLQRSVRKIVPRPRQIDVRIPISKKSLHIILASASRMPDSLNRFLSINLQSARQA